MYAIVDIAGQQFKVEKDQKLFVHRLEGEEGSKVTFDRVFLIDTDKGIKVGDPVVAGASVSATILGHLKGDKVLIFKKKRRKGFKKLTGHRQYLSQIRIEGISEKAAAQAATKAATTKESGLAEKEATPKKETATGTAEKKSAPKKDSAAGDAGKKAAEAPKKTAAKPKAAAAKPKAEAAKPAKNSDADKGETKK